ncbi:SusC/RagA family TonB-linked outer membrane protein [Flavobacterium amnicola]|uniref:SusC/RagA family TonB-linked outer membrane protein n=1 Tax=Flavobacterium amnicola TaxID=2506422 RepID=A0A4Q1K4I1_9FLAO|nr:SusC/RagA family TonB-linked outer membrane protein [Flavobacterium amnicola]RXR20462.1 SusC/RagA family TonB-linked outer membrane protein [Flavobacterium amnicola]
MRSKFKWIFTLLMALTMQFSFAQEKTITGVVSDASGPLPGVNVVVKGTQRGVSTGFDGSYSIKAKEGETLVYSFMGMRDFSKVVGASNVMNTVLQDATTSLTEVVVTAVGIKKSVGSITSSSEQVKAKELTQAQNPNVISALAGKVSGLQIINTGNGVNQNNRVQLRAPNSITGDNNALVVIDNAISTLDVLSRIPTENIESVNVMKGKQGAALYGSDGRNGVIIVSTKRGTTGDKVKVTLNSSVDFEDVNFIAQRQTRYGQGWSGSHVSYENGAWGAEFDGTIKAVGMVQANGQYIYAPYSPIKDNIKKFFNTGNVYQNNINISGGNLDKGFVNFTYNNQRTEFVVKGDELSRNSLTFRAGKKLNKFTVEGKVNYAYTKSTTTTQALLQELYQAATNIPVEQFENSGNEGAWTSYYRNPYWMRNNIRFNDDITDVNPQFNVNYEINKNINVNALLDYNIRNSADSYYRNGYTDLLQLGGGDHSTISQIDQTTANRYKLYSDLMVNFKYDLTSLIGFKGNIGMNNQAFNSKRAYVGGDDLVIPGFYNITNISSAPRTFTRTTTAYNNERFSNNAKFQRRSQGLFVNADFNLGEYLFLNLTGRKDWESRLTGDKTPTNTYFYPSAGISFVPTALESLKDGKILNSAKLTASYVKTGSAFPGDNGIYGINELGQLGTGYPFGSNSSFQQFVSITDPGLKPEFTETIEFSGKFGFLADRIIFGGSYYTEKNTDLITGITPSNTSGLANFLTNIGETSTKGFEVDLEFFPIRNDNFKWSNQFGFSTYKTTVDKVTDQSDEVSIFDNGEAGIFAVKGEEFPLIKGTAYERDPSGRVIIDAATGNPVRATEYKVLGKATPDYILNYNGYVDYKGLRLGVVMDYRTGHQFYAETKDWLSWSGHLYESAINGRQGFIYPNSVIETAPGVYTTNTNVVTGGTTYSSFLSYFQDEYADIAENSVLDATALKIREISLSYTLPAKLLTGTTLSNVKFGVNARNPFIFLAKENRGYADPEFSNSGATSAAGTTNTNSQGFSPIGKYPQTRTIGFNINVSF